MLKLIASDVDGTLLQNGASAISEQLFSCINRLSDRGALFAVCSGRAYHDLRTMFAPVSDHVIFVSHDGALVMYKERALMKAPVDPSAAKLFCSKAAAEKQCSVFVSGKYISYFSARKLRIQRHGAQKLSQPCGTDSRTERNSRRHL